MIKSLFSLFWQIESIDDRYARAVQINLLKIILLTTFSLSILSAFLATVGVLPFGAVYSVTLVLYTGINLLAYSRILKDENFYEWAVNILIYSSLLTFSIMVVDVIDDAFRFVWFFLLAFSAYIFGGKAYGIRVSMMIYIIVFMLYFSIELYLSWYVLLTFVASFFAFNIFLLYFLIKINIDVRTLQSRIDTEVEQREKGEQILLRKYRMVNMGEMIDAIAHQWRQPLARANMILINMEEERTNQNYIDKKIVELMALNVHMSQTIDDFRHLLHDSKTISTFDIDSVMKEVLSLMQNQLAEIEVQYKGKDIEIDGYKNELIQVLIILLSNAIEVLAERKIEDKKISIFLKEQNDSIYLSIKDNAGGIEKSMQIKIFDPYITSKHSSGGTGLGLYIAKLMMDSMRGNISVLNRDKGAVFTLTIRKTL